MTTKKPLSKMDLKELQAEWRRIFGAPTNSKDASGIREKLEQKAAGTKPDAKPKAKAPKAAAAAPPPPDPARITAADTVARGFEADGQWDEAKAAWLLAAERATKAGDKARYRGAAAAAGVRAEAKKVIVATDVPTPGEATTAAQEEAIAQTLAAPPAPGPTHATVVEPAPRRPATTSARTPSPFTHDPRVLAKYKVGDVFTYENRKTGVTHSIKVVDRGFEYLGPVAEEVGKVHPRLGGLIKVVKGGGNWNLYLVFGFESPSKKRGAGRTAVFLGNYEAGYAGFLAAQWLPTPPADFAALVGAASGGSTAAQAKLADYAVRAEACSVALRKIAAVVGRVVDAAKAVAERAPAVPEEPIAAAGGAS